MVWAFSSVSLHHRAVTLRPRVEFELPSVLSRRFFPGTSSAVSELEDLPHPGFFFSPGEGCIGEGSHGAR